MAIFATLPFVLCLVLSLFAPSASAQSAKAVPEGADLASYPLRPANSRLTVAEIATYRLQPRRLEKDIVVDNYDAKSGLFQLDTLRAGTLVLVDSSGEPVYKEDCGNRVIVRKPCPVCPPVVVTATPQQQTVAPPPPPDDSWSQRFWNDLNWLLALILLAFILALLAWLLANAIRLLLDDYNRRWPSTPRPTPIPGAVRARHLRVVPDPVTTEGKEAVQQAAPAPTPEATFYRYGPYDHISIEDAGQAGYRVTGYNGDTETFIGTFRHAETENAQDRGEYVIVMV